MQLVDVRIQNHARLQDCDLEVREHLVFVGLTMSVSHRYCGEWTWHSVRRPSSCTD